MTKILFFCTLLITAGVLIQGCTASKTVIEDKTLPVPGYEIRTVTDTVYIFQPSPCDTAEILAMYCKGHAEGDTLGTFYKFMWESVKGENNTLRQRGRVIITKRDTVIAYKDTTVQVTEIIEEFGFWKRVQLVLATIGVLVVLVGAGVLGLKLGLFKLPF